LKLKQLGRVPDTTSNIQVKLIYASTSYLRGLSLVYGLMDKHIDMRVQVIGESIPKKNMDSKGYAPAEDSPDSYLVLLVWSRENYMISDWISGWLLIE